MKGKWFNYLVYASLVFLLIALIKSDYLKMPVIHDGWSLWFSVILVISGFLVSSESWRRTLLIGDVRITRSDGVISMGLSIFAKYIPGKVWVILGRAAYVSEKYKISRAATSSLSLTAQLIALWTGLLLGAFGLFWSGNIKEFNLGWPTIIIWLAFTLVIFTPWFNKLTKMGLSKVLKREVQIPVILFKKVVTVLPYFFLQWILWCAGFHLLCQSMMTELVPTVTGLGFALAGTLGILAIIVPGGLGVREGILTAFLMLLAFDRSDALSIAVASRLWFLIGETILFLVGWYFKRRFA